MTTRTDMLVETDWLAEHLRDSDVRVIECTVYLLPADVPSGFRVESGRAKWAEGHIPARGSSTCRTSCPTGARRFAS